MEKTQADMPAFEPQAVEIQGLWRKSTVAWALVVAAVMAAFWPTAVSIVDIWQHSSTFNHCFLILPIVGFLVWERRAVFSHILPEPSLWGGAVIALGGLAWLLGRVADAQVVQQFSFAVMLQGTVLAIFGRQAAKTLIFPLLYVLFAIPFGEFLVPGLQDITARITVLMLHLSGMPVFSDGVFISVPNGEFHVAEACSGVRFLIATLPLGVLFANIAFLSWRRRALVIILSLVVPIIANGLRAYGIIMIAYLTNNKYAIGVDHLIYGWIFFAAVTLVFLAIGRLFMDRPHDAPVLDLTRISRPVGKPSSVLSFFLAAALAVVAALAAPFYSQYLVLKPGYVEALTLRAPQVTGDWKAAPPDANSLPWEPSYKGVDAKLVQNYVRRDGVRVTLYIGYYSHQRHGAEVLAYGNTVAAPAPWSWASGGRVEVPWDGRRISVNAAWIVSAYDRRRVWYWYWVDHRFTANPIVAKLLNAKARIMNTGSEAAVIAVSVGDAATNERKIMLFQDFLAHLKAEPPIWAPK